MSVTSTNNLSELEERFRAEIEGRMNELRPMVEEYERYQLRLQQFDQITKTSTRGRRSSSAAGAPRSRQGGTHKDRLVALVQEKPGLTVSEAARELGLESATYLYRTRTNAVNEGLIAMDGSKMVPAAAPVEPVPAAA